MRTLPILLAAAAALAQTPVRLADIPAELRPRFGVKADSETAFESLRLAIDRRTDERERQGEQEHLIYFILQSGVFTKRPRIEPALSARQFVESLPAPHRSRLLERDFGFPFALPADVRARMEDFLAALRRPVSDERMIYWKRNIEPAQRSARSLTLPYARAMRFLYEKEFLASPGDSGELYQRRGHSVDTQVEANYAVSTALAVLSKLDPGAGIEKVLIVGPGLDLAPRTGLRDEFPPQSYQPYLTADSLLRWGLASDDRLSVQCVDINPEVVHFIERFARRRSPELRLAAAGGEADYRLFFREAGDRIGAVEGTPWGKIVRVRPELAARVHAERLNILTERYQPSPGFDLVVATNVLLYFDSIELALALANIQAMLRPGGYFVHNELRAEVEEITKLLGMPPIQGRTLQIAHGEKRPLVDAFVIHRKE
jgi:hypothetical protein